MNLCGSWGREGEGLHKHSGHNAIVPGSFSFPALPSPPFPTIPESPCPHHKPHPPQSLFQASGGARPVTQLSGIQTQPGGCPHSKKTTCEASRLPQVTSIGCTGGSRNSRDASSTPGRQTEARPRSTANLEEAIQGEGSRKTGNQVPIACCVLMGAVCCWGRT